MTLPGWEANTWVAIGTIVLAAVTLLLALAATAQVRMSRRALEASVRPLLVDIPIGGDGEPDAVSDDGGVTEIEVHLRNGGAGLALIAEGPRLIWDAFPTGWSGVAQQLVVLPGEEARFTFRQTFGSAKAANDVALAVANFAFEIAYSDGNGKQKARTRAYVVKHADEDSTVDLFIDRIDISHRRLWWRKPVSLTGRSTPRVAAR